MIYGDGIRLRAIEKDDLPVFVRWLNDPEVKEGLFIHLPLSHVLEEKWFEKVLGLPHEEQPMVIEISAGDGWVMIGSCGMKDINWPCRSCEVGIAIGDKNFWNMGYGTSTMRLLLKHGFSNLNLNRIELEVFEDNPRAIRAYEKAGFVREGVKRQAQYKSNRYVDVLIMSVLRSEWEGGVD